VQVRGSRGIIYNVVITRKTILYSLSVLASRRTMQINSRLSVFLSILLATLQVNLD